MSEKIAPTNEGEIWEDHWGRTYKTEKKCYGLACNVLELYGDHDGKSHNSIYVVHGEKGWKRVEPKVVN